jgi:hypothetical protein
MPNFNVEVEYTAVESFSNIEAATEEEAVSKAFSEGIKPNDIVSDVEVLSSREI